MITKLNRLKKTENHLFEKNGRSPTIEDISENTDLSPEVVSELTIIDNSQPLSMDMPVNEESDSVLYDFVVDKTVELPAVSVETKLFNDDLIETLNVLDDREREIIELRFGIKDGNPKTLEEISRVFGITRERVRQLIVQALGKLKDETDFKDPSYF
jgi:RNA polymerase primary sigma factor